MVNFKIINKDKTKWAVTEDGVERKVQIDDNGMEYFYVPNPYRDHSIRYNLMEYISINIIRAILAIREGNAQGLKINNFDKSFLSDEFLIWFVDEEYGEQVRQEFIEKFKEVKIGYRIMFEGVHSMVPTPRPLYLRDGNYYATLLFETDDVLVFQEMKDAQSVIDELERKADDQIIEYKRISNEKSAETQDIKFDDAINKGLFTGVIGDMVEYRYYKGTDRELDFKYYIYIVPHVVSSPPIGELIIR